MERRLVALFAMCLMGFAVVLASLAGVVTDPRYAEAAAQQTGNLLLLSEGRGNIYDCAFTPLTGTVNETCALIAPGRESYHSLFTAIPEALRADFYANIQRGAPFLMPVTGEGAARVEYVFHKPVRYQPLAVAPHIVGYRNAEGAGVAGVEYAFDSILQGGSTQVEVYCVTNARGGFISAQEPYALYTQGTGAGVMLTLDETIQRLCEGVAAETVDKGCIVVLDTATGRVRASVSMPTFDPEDIAASIERQDTSLVNRATGAYNVGSVIKPLFAAAALEAGVDAGETYNCTGSIEVGGHVYRCAYGRGHGEVDMRAALEQSCNCYFVELGLRLGAEAMHDVLERAGFGRSTPLAGSISTARGNLPTEEQLRDLGQLSSVSFGQGALTATPLQVAAMMNLFAGNGRYIAPTFVEGIVDEYSKSITESLYAPVQRQVFKQETVQAVREMLIGVVDEGLGQKALPLHGGAGGKTGTAQTGRYNEAEEEIMDAWFAGFWPADEPRYTIAVLLDSGTHGSDDAAAVFERVTSALGFLQMGVQEDSADGAVG